MLKRLFTSAKPPASSLSVIVVSGLPRSGTSMMMRMLEATGLEIITDMIRTADQDNPRGYYEFERVKQLDKGDYDWLDDADGKVVKVISALLEYLPAGHGQNRFSYKILFVRRNMDEILASQRKMLVRRGEDPEKTSDAELRELFQKHVARIEEWLGQQPNMDVLDVDYNQLLGDPAGQIPDINRFLGGHLDEQKMAAVVDADLYRNRA